MQNIARYLSTERVAVVALNFKGHSKSTDHVVWHRKFYCNYISVLHRYPDTATSRSKIAVSVFFDSSFVLSCLVHYLQRRDAIRKYLSHVFHFIGD